MDTHQQAAPVIDDEPVERVEVIDEIDRVVYVFRDRDGIPAEVLADHWSLTGEQTYAETRPMTSDDDALADEAHSSHEL